MWTTAAGDFDVSRSRTGSPVDALDVQVVSRSCNSARRQRRSPASTTPARRRCCSWMATASTRRRRRRRWSVTPADQGDDVVFTAKASRSASRACAGLAVKGFYALINWGARQKIPEDAGDFRLLSPRAAAALRQMPERNRFFKGLATWIGFRQIRIDYEPAARIAGQTKWNVRALLGLSIEGLTSFSVAPLRLASLLGLLLAAAALIFGVQILVETILYGKDVPGYPSVVVGLMVLGGVQLIMIGIMGEYIGKILSELKARPVYFVAEHSLKTTEDAGRADDPSARSAAE